MEKRLRSSLKTSADEFLSYAAKLGLRSAKPSLKTLIHTTLSPSSPLITSLPLSLRYVISQSVPSSSNRSSTAAATSPSTPPTKRPRRSSRHAKDAAVPDASPADDVAHNLQVYTYIVLLCISHPNKVFSSSPDLLLAARELHDNLIVLESDSVLCSEILNLCEEWWKEELPGRETLITQSLPYLLSRSLTLKKKVDVHRIYALREAFPLFDFEDESIEDLKVLLIRCLISPLYLKTEDGRKFIASVFGLNVQLMREALSMVRSQILFERKSMLEAYGDIVFRAWKALEGELRDEIENGFLQGMVEGAIHASSGSLAASVRRVLGVFVTQRTTEGVEKLFFRLAEPVIFRSLQVANSNVRQNALHLLLDMFPLEDPDCTKEVKDTLQDKQFFLLERLLLDECPDIRVVAVEGSCRTLNLFWEIIPSSTITKIITKVFDDMTYDTCSEVRLSTLSGITYLLGNPQSHDVLKVLLPRIGHLIKDTASSVRAALVELLLLLRDIRNFQFHKVVHIDVLLSTLANDQPSIARKITKLLMPSYFPSKVAVEEACNRCLALVKRSPKAGARFCEFSLLEGASLQSLLELLKVLIGLALSPANLLGDQIDGLIVASAYLCKHLVSEACYKNTLKGLFSGKKLRCLFQVAASRQAKSSVCDIICSISPDDVNGIFENCMALVTSCSDLSENMERQAEVRSVHKMMLSCNWIDEMLVSLTGLLQKTVYGCHARFGTNIERQEFSAKHKKLKLSTKNLTKRKHLGQKKSSTTTLSFEEDYSIALGIAWQIKDLLVDENTRKAILESPVLDAAFLDLKVISEVSIMQSMCCDYMHVSTVLAYTDLALHISLQNVALHGASKQQTRKNSCPDSAGSSLEPILVKQTMDHLFDCTNKLFESGDSEISGKVPSRSNKDRNKAPEKRSSETDASDSSNAGSRTTGQKRVSNTVKILTAFLKFIVDASSLDLVYDSRERCLKYTLNYLKFITKNLRQYSCDKQQVEEEDMKETFLCLKSCFTYTAKLLNLNLANSDGALLFSKGAHDLANSLLDLFVSVELYLGTGYATRIVAAMKPWLPDLVLALGSKHIWKQNNDESEHGCHSTSNFPLWPSYLAKIEIQKMSEAHSDEEVERVDGPDEFPAFKKLMEMVILLLRENNEVLDAVGMVLLTSTVVALERKEFELVLGLLHFICENLVQHKDGEWLELIMMLAFLRDLYPQMQRVAEELSDDDDKRQILQNALILLEPVTTYFYGNQKEHMEEI